MYCQFTITLGNICMKSSFIAPFPPRLYNTILPDIERPNQDGYIHYNSHLVTALNQQYICIVDDQFSG